MGKAENPIRVGITNNNCIMKTLRKFILLAVVVIFMQEAPLPPM
jgi:hypothetical protein